MLVLARTCDQSIIIGDDIKITVIGIRGNKVRLGIEAPKNIPVHREEVYLQIGKADEFVADTGVDDPTAPAEELRKAG